MINTITILGGYSRSGNPEPVERIDMKMGDVVSIVGPTGSGKTTLINDLELFADANTQTAPCLISNERHHWNIVKPAMDPIAPITQHTTFLSSTLVDFWKHMRVTRSKESN
jgi:ABC-type lipoprotein export system ATPase subunit